MKRRFLEIKKGKKTIRSKCWNFEAMCLIDDNREKGSIFEICIDCILYLFDELDKNYIMHLGAEKLHMLCTTTFLWYKQDIMMCQKSSYNIMPSNRQARLRELYRELFVNYGILPDRLEKQNPELLFYILLNNQRQENLNIPPQLQMLYGM